MSPTVTERPQAAPQQAAPPEQAPAAKTDGRGKPDWRIVQIGVELIGPSPYQPRLSFDPDETAELVASVRERGVQQPILVRTAKLKSKTEAEPQENGAAGNGTSGNGRAPRRPRYELIAGERRLRACREASRRHIPAIIRDDLSDRECAELALLENIQRSNLSVIEEARGYRQLMLKFGMKEERIAKKVGKSVQTVQGTLRLLQLPEEVQALIAQKKLSASHGQELLALAPFERVCASVARHASENRLTAASLGANPLPNAPELKCKGLLEELDYKTKFDWRSVCEACPHKAFVRSGYASYCLQPEEWKKKQETAVAQAKDEAARAMEQLRDQVRAQEQEGRVDTSALPAGSYRNLSVTPVPQGCGAHCPCRRETRHPHAPETSVPICVDPARLKSLQEQERAAHEEKRQRHFTRLWEQANQVLEGEKAEPRKAAALLTALVLGSELHRYGYGDESGALARSVARAVGLVLPWDELLEAEDEAAMFKLLARNPAEEAAPSETNGADDVPTEAAEPPDPARLLLFAASLLLVQEVRSAVRFGGETPRLQFVLGPQHEAQLELRAEESPDARELPPHDPGDEEEDPFAHEELDPLEEELLEDEPFDEQPEDDSGL